MHIRFYQIIMQYTRSSLAWASGLSLISSSLAAAIGGSILDERAVHHGFADIPDWFKEEVPVSKVFEAGDLQKRQQPGAECYQDDFFSVVVSDQAATPFCSSFIGIPARTALETITEYS